MTLLGTVLSLVFIFRDEFGFGAYLEPTTNVIVAESPPLNVIEIQHALISGYHRDGDYDFPVDLLDMVAKFTGMPFILEWRGCSLVAIFPYPLDFGDDLHYHFWPDGNEKLEYSQERSSDYSDWKSKDQPETTFYRHHAGGAPYHYNNGPNADKWNSVTLVVQRSSSDENDALQYEIASVEVPDFRETLHAAVSTDLNTEFLNFPRENVFEPPEQYFQMHYNYIDLTRYYCADLSKVVSTDGDPLSHEERREYESPTFRRGISYNNGKKWEWDLGVHNINFVKADATREFVK
eukprot:255548_1